MQEDSRAGLAILLHVICIILSVCVFFNSDGFGSGVPEGLLHEACDAVHIVHNQLLVGSGVC
jgi:hypothetical protein